jgi:RNA polymerase sigma-70 factor (ECF subfamily)
MRDRKYIDRFQAGDFDAFGVLYERYIDNIFAFVYRKTSNKEVAEDLTSRVWMKALKSLEFFWERDNANFKSWIYRIAQNTVIDYYRTCREQVDIDAIVEVGISKDFALEIDNSDKLWRVTAYLSQLTTIEQEIVTLRIWDDLSYKQIAGLLWKKEDNCKKTFSRALKKIQGNIVMIMLLLFIF